MLADALLKELESAIATAALAAGQSVKVKGACLFNAKLSFNPLLFFERNGLKLVMFPAFRRSNVN